MIRVREVSLQLEAACVEFHCPASTLASSQTRTVSLGRHLTFHLLFWLLSLQSPDSFQTARKFRDQRHLVSEKRNLFVAVTAAANGACAAPVPSRPPRPAWRMHATRAVIFPVATAHEYYQHLLLRVQIVNTIGLQ
jgi:hypothetical protein